MKLVKPFFYFLLVVIIISSAAPANVHSHSSADLTLKQGASTLYSIKPSGLVKSVTGKMKNTVFHFYPGHESGVYQAIIGVDFAEKPSDTQLVVTIKYQNGKVETRTLAVHITEAKFKVQKLTLPDKKVDLSTKNLKRAKSEQASVKKLWKPKEVDKLWKGSFIVPSPGRISGSFGKKRIINGSPRSPHTGEDISAPAGTPVKASNNGLVSMVADHFFSGKSIFINHGTGIFSMYFHLSKTDVKEGDYVKKGEIIGRVGSSGRATGAHLHWGMRIYNQRINPVSLTALEPQD